MAQHWIRRGAAEAEVIERAHLDPITEVLNRAAMLEMLADFVPPGRLPNPGDAVLWIDLDGLDGINQGYGHLTGDRLLMETARVVKQILGSGGVVGRIAGDEFLLVVRGDDSQKTVALAEAMRSTAGTTTVMTPFGSQAAVTVSIGLAFLRDPRLYSVDTILAAAGAALARAKAAGGNRVVVFDEESTLPG